MLDGLRGLALLGILTANLWSFSGYSFLTSLQRQQLPTYELDRWVYAGLRVLIDSKFSTIFSLLFGVGFALQIGRWGPGRGFGRYYARRMVLLLAIACLHAYALWSGDILRYYALAGLVLLLVRHWSDRALLLTGCLLVAVVTPVVFLLNEWLISPTADGLTGEKILSIFAQGTFQEVLQMNWRIDDVRNFWQGSPLVIVTTTGKVMLGYWMGRIGVFTRPTAHRALLKRWFWWGLGLGIPSSVVFWAVRSGALVLTPSLAGLLFVVAGGMVLQSLFYISAFVQAFGSTRGAALLRPLVPVGRMALTNYLLQTFTGLFLFYGCWPGPHLMGQVGAANLLLLGITVYALQVVFSHWWLATHEMGPIEWLWRRLSYRRRPKAARITQSGR